MTSFKLLFLLIAFQIIASGRLLPDRKSYGPFIDHIRPHLGCGMNKYWDRELSYCKTCTVCPDESVTMVACKKMTDAMCGDCSDYHLMTPFAGTKDLWPFAERCYKELGFATPEKLAKKISVMNVEHYQILDVFDAYGPDLEKENTPAVEPKKDTNDIENLSDFPVDSFETSSEESDDLSGELYFHSKKMTAKQLKEHLIIPHRDDDSAESLFDELFDNTSLTSEEETEDSKEVLPEGESQEDSKELKNEDEAIKEHVEDYLGWEKWVDDRVKPIILKKIEDIEEIRTDAQEVQMDKVIIVTSDFDSAQSAEKFQREVDIAMADRKRHHYLRAGLVILLFAVLGFYFIRICCRRPTYRTMELSAADRNILTRSGEYAAKHLDNQVHENPLCAV